MSIPYKHIAVTCGPLFKGDQTYDHAAGELGHSIGRRNVCVTAAGDKALLATFARSASSEGSQLKALFAEKFEPTWRIGPMFPNAVIPDAAERRTQLIKDADMMVALPGEIDECLKFGKSGRPVIIVNMNGEFKKAKDTMAQALSDGKIGHNSVRNIHWARCVDEAMDIFDHLQLNAL